MVKLLFFFVVLLSSLTMFVLFLAGFGRSIRHFFAFSVLFCLFSACFCVLIACFRLFRGRFSVFSVPLCIIFGLA